MTNFKKLTLKDLGGKFDLENWLHEVAGKFINKKISNTNLLITLRYLKDCIKKSDLEDKSGWMIFINNLEDRLEADENE